MYNRYGQGHDIYHTNQWEKHGLESSTHASMRAGQENLTHVADGRSKNISALWACCKSSCAEHLEKVVKANMNPVSSNKETLKTHTPSVAYMSVVPLRDLSSENKTILDLYRVLQVKKRTRWKKKKELARIKVKTHTFTEKNLPRIV